VPSWNVLGGENRPFTLEVRVRQPDGQWSRYFSFGSWQAATGRRSAPRRLAAGGWVDTDTLKLPYRASAFQFRYQAAANQQMKLLSFNTSDTSLRFQQAGGRPLPLERLLNVPSYSQMIYPGGGEVWCSPTSVGRTTGQRGAESCGFNTWFDPTAEQFRDRPGVIRHTCGHPRRSIHPPTIHLHPK